MSRANYVPVRLSDREMEMVKETSKRVGATNTSEGVRYSIVHTAQALKKEDPILKPGETIVTLPDKLISRIEGLKGMDDVDLEMRLWILIGTREGRNK